MIDLKRHWPLALAIVLLVVISTGLLVAQSDASALRCDLAPTSSAMQARVSATCYRARKLAAKIGEVRGVRSSVNVPADACSAVEQNTFVWDCRFAVHLDAGHGFRAQDCGGVVRVRGRSSHPRRLSTRLRSQTCE